jgi:hypothetical protein
MKTVFFNKFKKIRESLRDPTEMQLQESMEDFKTYISHYKTAQEETSNFLSYYETEVRVAL